MTRVDLELTLGDSDDILITVEDDASPPRRIDLSQAVDGTADRPAIIRVAVKKDPARDLNSEAVLFKTSYAVDEIEILPQALDATKGQCRVRIDKPDTEDEDAGDYSWDVEVTRQDIQRTGAQVGTLTLTEGSKTITGVGTAFTKAKVGDVIHPTSGAADGRPVVISKIVSDTQAESEYAWPTGESDVTFELRRGKSKTAASGTFTLVQDVVK